MGWGGRWIGGDGFREGEGLGRKMGWVMALGWLREMACSPPNLHLGSRYARSP